MWHHVTLCIPSISLNRRLQIQDIRKRVCPLSIGSLRLDLSTAPQPAVHPFAQSAPHLAPCPAPCPSAPRPHGIAPAEPSPLTS